MTPLTLPSAIEMSAGFSDVLDRLGLEVDTLIGNHGRTATRADLREMMARRRPTP